MASPRDPNLPRRLALSSLVCFALVLLSIFYVDRPVSTWAFQTFHGMAAFRQFTYLVTPIAPAACIGLIILALVAAFGKGLGAGSRTVLACCLSIVIAFTLKEHLKYAFGRTWPETFVFKNPSWISSGAFGFHPFHGGTGWESFPSGHTTMIVSVVGILWKRIPGFRWAWGTLACIVVVGLIGADYHFVSDVIAGGFLGWACAEGVMEFVN